MDPFGNIYFGRDLLYEALFRELPEIPLITENEPRMHPVEVITRAKNVVEFSFIVQKSLTYLDLSLSEFSNFKREFTQGDAVNEFEFQEDGFKNIKIIFTEEACKKRLAHNRKLLYNYHLDVSKEVEGNLRKISEKFKLNFSHGVLLNYIFVDIYKDLLKRIVKEAFQQTNQKVKLIHKVSKIAIHSKSFPKIPCIRENGLNYLHLQGADSRVVNDYLTAMNFDDAYYFNLPIDEFKFVLYHAGYSLSSYLSCADPIHHAISRHVYAKVGSLLKYLSSPEKSCRHEAGHELNIAVRNGLISSEREFLVSKILLVYKAYNPVGLEAMQMIWRSIPDPFVTLEELTLVISQPPESSSIQNIKRFIKDITGEDVPNENYHPRKLKHYCRILIRNILSNNQKLSTGIDELTIPSVSGDIELPPSINSYLKLEK